MVGCATSRSNSSSKKVEKTQTRCVANQYADDYVEKYYVDLYLKQQMQAASK
ncbi:hypothetical protein PYR77_06370 [Acinetobacter soli]|nr:hypothetical protein [Acinetobacter soli]WEH92900.1 hypothetical protein PYR75_06775 [Acinetobacter soli]WEI01518.1 hypothetical protein PYR77_06370 [Acinetobacter soli]